MNAKIVIAMFAAFAMLFAGVAVADSADADTLAPAPSEESGAEDDEGASEEDTAPVIETVPISYEVGDYTFMVNQDKTNIILKDLAGLGATAPTGEKFVKWIDENDKSYVAGSTFILGEGAEGATLTAVFEPITYTAQFVDSDGTPIAKVLGTLAEEKNLKVLAPADPKQDGMIFAGWLAEGAEKPVAKDALGLLTADITYTAVYTVDFVVKFVDGTTTNTMSVSTIRLPDEVTREGFTFLGWYVGTEQVEPLEYVKTATADMTFTAKWEPINCYVTFIAGDFSKTVPVLYGQTVGQLALPEGFESWNFDFTTLIKEDVTIEAVEAAPAEPTGLDDPVTQTFAILGGLVVIILLAAFASRMKKGESILGFKIEKNKKKDKEDEE